MGHPVDYRKYTGKYKTRLCWTPRTVKSVELFEMKTETTQTSLVLELRVQLDVFVVVVACFGAERVQNS